MGDADKKMLKGTTTVGVVFDKGVALAADKRAVLDSFIASKSVQKIYMLDDRIAMTLAGGVGDAQSLARLMKAELELYKYSKGEPIPVQGAATLLANILQGNKYFPYFVQLIIAGFDSKPRLFDLDIFGGLLSDKYLSTGSGSIVAYGILDEHYKEGISKEEALKLAAKAVDAAMKRDNATGEGIDLVCITSEGVKRYSESEVSSLLP
ncbi:archaeal proteasome endopeptidase complex subunit beta [Candidatus Micrarchaeota archaeon]|nr:archaeal proteasome endopeptidase complex subunit beta [Candidatus Micrarchaeota archaeon]